MADATRTTCMWHVCHNGCRGSRVGCNSDPQRHILQSGWLRGDIRPLQEKECAGDTPAATVTRDRLQRFHPDMASRPRFSRDRRAPDSRERNSISLRNFRRCAECDQRIRAAKVWATPA
jgi:hypothetical protein